MRNEQPVRRGTSAEDSSDGRPGTAPITPQSGRAGREASGPTGQEASGPTGQEASGPTGQEASGPTGQEASGPTGQEASEPTGQEASGPTGQEASGRPGREPWTSITACPDGPLLVRGDAELLTADGSVIPRRRATVALCRCGASGIKPFCDGSHKVVGFRTDDERVARDAGRGAG